MLQFCICCTTNLLHKLLLYAIHINMCIYTCQSQKELIRSSKSGRNTVIRIKNQLFVSMGSTLTVQEKWYDKFPLFIVFPKLMFASEWTADNREVMKILTKIKMPKQSLLDNEKLIASIPEKEMKTAIEKFASSEPPVELSTSWDGIKLLRKNQRSVMQDLWELST